MIALHGKRWLLAALPPATLAAGAGFWVLRHYDPNSASSPFPPCSFLAVTGYYCIGCGLTYDVDDNAVELIGNRAA